MNRLWSKDERSKKSKDALKIALRVMMIMATGRAGFFQKKKGDGVFPLLHDSDIMLKFLERSKVFSNLNFNAHVIQTFDTLNEN